MSPTVEILSAQANSYGECILAMIRHEPAVSVGQLDHMREWVMHYGLDPDEPVRGLEWSRLP